jgi:hypothetical protein
VCVDDWSLDQIPHMVQMVMAGETTLILAGAILAFEMFMSKWEQIAELHPRFSKWINVSLSWATHYYTCMDRTRAYIMAMGEWCDLWVIIIP